MPAALPFALAFAIAVALAAIPGRTAVAQDLEPRNYRNAPVGLNFLVAAYTLSDGAVLFDPSVALENAEIEIDGPVVGYARILDIAGRSAKFDAAIGDVCLDGSADFQGQRVSRSVCGATDARIRLAVNLIGAPALTAAEFGEYRQDLVVGASFLLSAPVGQYDETRLVNIGTNRWAARAEIGMSRIFAQRWQLELALAGNFFEDNDAFFGGNHRSQEEIWSLQAHLVRGFATGVWLAFDATHYEGGRTALNGVPSNDLQSNSRFGMTVSVPINRRQSMKFGWSSGVATRTGTDFDLYALAWQYRWGGGI